MNEVVAAIQALVGTVVLGAGAIVTWRKANREAKHSENDLMLEHMKAQDDSIIELRKRLDRSEGRERVRDDYIQLLRQHIASGKPPPPPPFPESLTG